MSKKIVIILFAALVLMLSACERSASTPLPTPTLDANFPQPVATNNNMSLVEQAGTQTAIALVGTPQGGTVVPGDTSQVPTVTPLGGLPQAQPTLDATQIAAGTVAAPVLPSPTPSIATASVPQPTVEIARPGTYALKEGEFPYCIARRFNLNPEELLALNGLKEGSLYLPGLVLKIPATGNGFPGSRALRTHPATYTVKSGDTIYSIACDFGDVDPVNIAAVNGLQAPYSLTTGASINIP